LAGSLSAMTATLHASEPDYLTFEEQDAPSTADEVIGPIDAILRGPRQDLDEPDASMPAWKKNASPFWRDSSLVIKPRSYYLNRDRDKGQNNEAWALGGALAFTSGQWLDRLSVGATVYTSQKLYGPKDKDGTLLLKPGQQGFTTVGEAWMRLRLYEEHELRVGRQTFNLPHINRREIRMVPNTFEGIVVDRPVDTGFAYIAGYISRMKQINQSRFISMSEAAGAKTEDKGLAMAGARYSFGDHSTIGAINEHSFDVMNVFYVEGETSFNLDDAWGLGLSAQYSDQRSVGSELAGNFKTHLGAAKIDLSYKDAILTVAGSRAGNDAMKNPFGSPPTYLSIIVDNFDRAREKAWLVGMSYNFKGLGLDGLSTFANIAHGNTPDSGSKATPDETEYDLTIDYRFKKGALKGLWARVRGAYIDQDEDVANGDDFFDFRIILNYEYDIF
jgi:hypothetical protein